MIFTIPLSATEWEGTPGGAGDSRRDDDDGLDLVVGDDTDLDVYEYGRDALGGGDLLGGGEECLAKEDAVAAG